jgi:hypothetical protein
MPGHHVTYVLPFGQVCAATMAHIGYDSSVCDATEHYAYNHKVLNSKPTTIEALSPPEKQKYTSQSSTVSITMG